MICLLKPDSRINPPSQQNESPARMINHSKGKETAPPGRSQGLSGQGGWRLGSDGAPVWVSAVGTVW